MELSDLRKLKTLQTKAISLDCSDQDTLKYVSFCLDRFYRGDFGELEDIDIRLNMIDLNYGRGHIIAKYPNMFNLSDELLIESHFDKDEPDNVDANFIMIMYPYER